VSNLQPRNWRTEGVKVIKSDRLDSNTPQTPGMLRAAAVNSARGAQKIWAGTVIIHPNAKTGAHHHGALESVIYVVRGVARMRWGERLEFVAEADAGDFIFVPPYVPHQEINRSSDTPLECVLMRSDNESVVVNLNIDAAERVEEVYWIDPIHRDPPAWGPSWLIRWFCRVMALAIFLMAAPAHFAQAQETSTAKYESSVTVYGGERFGAASRIARAIQHQPTERLELAVAVDIG
jgi:uncharacterized RmlC-like cupin family protein